MLSLRDVFLITKELIFGFQILDLKDHFSASLRKFSQHILTRIVASKLRSKERIEINAINFKIVGISQLIIKLFMLRYHFKALSTA